MDGWMDGGILRAHGPTCHLESPTASCRVYSTYRATEALRFHASKQVVVVSKQARSVAGFSDGTGFAAFTGRHSGPPSAGMRKAVIMQVLYWQRLDAFGYLPPKIRQAHAPFSP